MKIHAQHQVTKELSAQMHLNKQDLHWEIMHQITHAMATLMMQTADYKTTNNEDTITHEMGGHFFGMIEFRKIRNDIRDIIYDNSIAIKDKWAQIESLLGDTGCEKYQTSAQEREKRVSELLKNNKTLNGINKSYKEASVEKEDKITRLEIALKAANEQIKGFDGNMVLQRLSTAASAPEHMKREILHFLYQSINQDILGQPTLNDESPALKNGTEAEYSRLAYQNLAKVNQTLQAELDRKHQIIFEKDSKLNDYGEKFKDKNKLIEKQKHRIEILEHCNALHQKTINDFNKNNVVEEIKRIEKFLWKKFPWSWPKFRSK